MPTVATLYERASNTWNRLEGYKRRGRKLPRGGKVNHWLTVPQAAAVMGCLEEKLLAGEEQEEETMLLSLRALRGSIHQQLCRYEGLAYEEPDTANNTLTISTRENS